MPGLNASPSNPDDVIWSNISSSQLEPIDIRILEAFELVDGARILQIFNSRYSVAKLLLVDLRPKYSDGPKGPHIIRIDHSSAGHQEASSKGRVRNNFLSKFLPDILEIQEVDGWTGIIYKLAIDSVLTSRPLTELLSEASMGLGSLKEVVTELGQALFRWNMPVEVEKNQRTVSIAELFKEELAIAYDRLGSQDDIVRVIEKAIDPHRPLLLFDGVKRPLPNPLTQIGTSKFWNSYFNINPPPIIRFASQLHGDLSCDNIIISSRIHRRSTYDISLIGLDNFRSDGPLFIDHAFLELDIFLRSLPLQNYGDYAEWIYLAEHIYSNLFPTGIPKGIKAPVAWDIIKQLRSSIEGYIDQPTAHISTFYQVAFWISHVTAALSIAHSPFVNLAERFGTILLGALSLDKVLKLLGVEGRSEEPLSLSWDLVMRSEASFKRMRQDGHQDDLDRLTEAIVDLLRSPDDLTISSKISESSPTNTVDNVVIVARNGNPELVISSDQVRYLVRGSPSSIDMYLARVIVNQDFGPWITRYVPLAGVMQKQVIPEHWMGNIPVQLYSLHHKRNGPEWRIERTPIEDITSAINSYRQFVILGEPGSGKTTILQKLTLEFTRKALLNSSSPIPLFVRLSSYRSEKTPFDFLDSIWNQRLGKAKDAPTFNDALRDGRVVLLLDALNEMNRTDYESQITAWRDFIREYDHVQMVFSCREMDYTTPLQIQQIEVAPLDDDKIYVFLKKYIGSQGDLLWAHLRSSELLDLARNPFLLSVLAWIQAQFNDPLPLSRGELLDNFATALIRREELMAHSDWIGVEALTAALSTLAWEFQQNGEGTSAPTRIVLKDILPSRVEIRGRLFDTPSITVLRLGQAANIIDETIDGQIRFAHHLLQELFAARELRRRFDEKSETLDTLWKIPWFIEEMPFPENQQEWDPLPPPPSTGWEETTIVAAGIMSDATELIDQIRKINPILAGRCLIEGNVHVADQVGGYLRRDLLDVIQNKAIHLRVRLLAGKILGSLGDPRFTIIKESGNPYIKPNCIPIPSGEYFIGSEENEQNVSEDELPHHQLRLNSYMIGKYPVTVAEFRCFLEAGGYENEQWWRTKAALAWLKGEEIEGGAIAGMLMNRRKLLDSGQPLKYWANHFGWQPKTFEFWKRLTSVSEEEAREILKPIYMGRTRRQPEYWDDKSYNGPNKPVVGVTWFEAQAYCAWLSAVSGSYYRLPTEAEWEVAARGGTGLIYPWGNSFDTYLTNTIEGRVLSTSPVGIYPEDASRLSMWDAAGNVREWTLSLFRPYPYIPEDGREDEDSMGERVMRGGAWSRSYSVARCAFRDHFGVDFCDYNIGFRICSPDQ